MSRVSRSLLKAATCLIITGAIFLGMPLVVAAQAPSGGANTIITAAITPVRYIVINNHGQITEILSNCRANVTPSVYRNSFNTPPIELSPAIYSQYAAIMAHTDTRGTGVIYQLQNSRGKKPTGLAGLISLISYLPQPTYRILHFT
jgi:hypothetical protein